jgi:hypothetical protein
MVMISVVVSVRDGCLCSRKAKKKRKKILEKNLKCALSAENNLNLDIEDLCGCAKSRYTEL